MTFPFEEKYIAKAESELGVRFPDSFRQKMMKKNGEGVEVGTDYFELHPFYKASDKKRIKRTCNSIVHETKMARDHYRLPAIGINGGGDVLVFKIQQHEIIDPTVYWFNHETEELVIAANNFNELTVSA
jgi:hypothetical protein